MRRKSPAQEILNPLFTDYRVLGTVEVHNYVRWLVFPFTERIVWISIFEKDSDWSTLVTDQNVKRLVCEEIMKVHRGRFDVRVFEDRE